MIFAGPGKIILATPFLGFSGRLRLNSGGSALKPPLVLAGGNRALRHRSCALFEARTAAPVLKTRQVHGFMVRLCFGLALDKGV